MAAPKLNPLGEKYDPNVQNLFEIPNPNGGQGNIIDVNTLNEGAVNELIQKYGGHPALLGRAAYLQNENAKNVPAAPTTGEQVQSELQKRLDAALQQKTDALYGAAESAGADKIRRAALPGRAGLIEDAAATGNLRQPNFLPVLGQYDAATNNTVGDFLGSSALTRAGQQFDMSKFLETVLAGERRAGEQVDQFGKTLGYNYDALRANLNDSLENRASKERIAMLGPGSSGGGGDDIMSGALSGGVAGAAAGSKAHPLWGTLIGGLLGTGLGAYSGSRRK